MRIYQDIMRGVEVASDSYPAKEDDGVLKVRSSLIEVRDDFDDSTTTVYDLIHNYNYVEITAMKKEEFKDMAGKYGKKLIERLRGMGRKDEELVEVQARLNRYAGKVYKNLKDYEIYLPEGGEIGNDMFIVRSFEEDANGEEVSYFMFFRDGLELCSH